MLSRVLLTIVEFVIGLLFGAVMTFGHQASLTVAGIQLPWGLVLACLGALGLLLGYRLLATSRWSAFWVAAGLVVAVLVLSLPGPGGSVLVPAGVTGFIWVLAPTFIAVLVLVWPSRTPTPKTPSVSTVSTQAE